MKEPNSQNPDHPPKPLVLVHGSFHGAWVWDSMLDLEVPKILDVHALTLPGLGDDAANANPSISLTTHITYVHDYLEEHELRDVTLVVHSYAGIVGAGVLRDDAEGRIAKYVCIDCVVPEGGPEPHSYLEETTVGEAMQPPTGAQLELCTEPWQINPFSAKLFGLLEDELVDYVDGQVTCQPGVTFVEPLVDFDAAAYERVDATYIYTDFGSSDEKEPYTPDDLAVTNGRVGPWAAHDAFLEFIERSERFGFQQLTLHAAAHDCMVSDPGVTGDTLFGIALSE